MPRRSATALLILLLIGGNAAVVQAVAWAGMLAERAGRMEWSAAVDSTFSGTKPCPMCHAAAALRDEGNPTQPELKQMKKQMLAPPGTLPRLDPAADGGTALAMPATAGQQAGFRPAPLPPPPRAA